jgi:hypothetical protein
MRDPQVSLADRVKMALKALPRLHRKPKAGQSGNAIAGSRAATVQSFGKDAAGGGTGKDALATERDPIGGAGKKGPTASSTPPPEESQKSKAGAEEGGKCPPMSGAAPTTPNRTLRRLPNASYRQREYLTEAEVERLIDTARKRGRNGPRDAAAILLAYRHGLRAAELCQLRRAQVDLRHGRLHVDRAKGGIESVHPLHGRTSLTTLALLSRNPIVHSL